MRSAPMSKCSNLSMRDHKRATRRNAPLINYSNLSMRDHERAKKAERAKNTPQRGARHA